MQQRPFRSIHAPSFFGSVLVAASTSSKSALDHGIDRAADHCGDHRHIATRHGGIHESAVGFPRRSLISSLLICWFLDLAGWINVAHLASRSLAWCGSQAATDRRSQS